MIGSGTGSTMVRHDRPSVEKRIVGGSFRLPYTTATLPAKPTSALMYHSGAVSSDPISTHDDGDTELLGDELGDPVATLGSGLAEGGAERSGAAVTGDAEGVGIAGGAAAQERQRLRSRPRVVWPRRANARSCPSGSARRGSLPAIVHSETRRGVRCCTLERLGRARGLRKDLTRGAMSSGVLRTRDASASSMADVVRRLSRQPSPP